jgi:hypothetical protein
VGRAQCHYEVYPNLAFKLDTIYVRLGSIDYFLYISQESS